MKASTILERAENPDRLKYFKRSYRKKELAFVRRKLSTLQDPNGVFRRYCPNIPFKQQIGFLTLLNRQAFYGGAAGGGKSDALLMGAIEYVDQPNYAALIIRRTYAQLTKPDSILDRAIQWFRNKNVVYNPQEHKFTFPSGAVIQFGHLQYDKDVYNYDGPAFQYIAFDELTQFTEWQYRFLFSRLRRKKGMEKIPPRVRSASNPGGIGHLWVKDRFISRAIKRGVPYEDIPVFIPARLEDNKYLDAISYRKSLAELPPIERQQREFGDWDITPEGLIFRREWFASCVDQLPTTKALRCRFWDLAATGDAGDWTVGALVSRDSNGEFYVEDIVRGQWGPGDVEKNIKRVAQMDGVETRIRMEQEPGASGKLVINQFAKLLSGYNFKGLPSSKAKTVRWTPFATAAHNGIVHIVNGPWNHEFIQEIVNVPAEGVHDDQADAVSGAYAEVALSPQIYVGVSRVKSGKGRRERIA